jgi:hypothetical protein
MSITQHTDCTRQKPYHKPKTNAKGRRRRRRSGRDLRASMYHWGKNFNTNE